MGWTAISAGLEDLYRDLHPHPELSIQERRTAAQRGRAVEAAGYDVTEGVGGTGVVGRAGTATVRR